MAYPFPSSEGAGTSGVAHAAPSGKSSRKSSEDAFDVVREFKLKIDEDDNYIDFFQERIRLEEHYVKQLQKLYDRTVAIDSLHEDHYKQRARSSARRGWIEVRDYTSREIDSRNALIMALRTAIVPHLVKIKEEQERIRQGLKENLRVANEMYDDHFKHQVPKLKKAYWNKCQALEDHKRQEAAIAAQTRLLSTPSPSSPAETPQAENPTILFANNPPPPPPTLSPGTPLPAGLTETPYFSPPHTLQALPAAPERTDRSASISFQPGYASPNRPSTSSGRNRAGSNPGPMEKKDPKEVFQDLAVQGKKGFNAFMQKLGGDKGDREREEGGFVFVSGPVKEDDGTGLQRKSTSNRPGHVLPHGKGQEGGALKAVKAKRDVEDADKAYRTGVFHLESLRLRREKVQASALINLEQFNDELTVKLRSALSTYVDIVHATAATNAQATDVVRQVVNKIDPERDMSLFRSRLLSHRAIESTPVPYENFYVGPCKSLIFGVSLTDYDYARGEGGDHGRPPAIVEKCIAAIDQKGLDAEGIYRISGRKAGVQKMIQDIELDEEKFAFDETSDVHGLANVLKQYLRELPEPVFLLPHSERVKYSEDREQLIHSNFAALRGRLRRLPPIHQTTFQAIVEHLGRVQSRSGSNKMDSRNLALIFNSVLFGTDSGSEATALLLHHQQDTVLEDLITFSDLLFSADKDQTNAGQADETLAPGSSHTRLRIIDQPSDTPRSQAASTSDGIAAAVAAIGDPMGLLLRRGETSQTGAASSPFTPNDQLDLLFDPSIIPLSFADGVGNDYHVRPLSSSDQSRSHFDLLQDLTSSPFVDSAVYSDIFTHIKSCPHTYYIVVVIDKSDDQLVAAGTLMIERKHIRSGGSAGHIEDIVVSAKTQGKGLGGKLVKGLRDMSEGLGCYKTTLDCKEEKVVFYEKCGFSRRGVQMTRYTVNAEPSPMLFPSVPVPKAAPTHHGPTLTLPASSAPPLPPRPAPSEIDLTTPTTTSTNPVFASPLAPTGPRPTRSTSLPSGSARDHAAPAGPRPLPRLEPEHPHPDPPLSTSTTLPTDAPSEFPAWAAEGLGDAGLQSQSQSLHTSPQRDRKDSLSARRSITPLPPGAAPPDLSAEPTRVQV